MPQLLKGKNVALALAAALLAFPRAIAAQTASPPAIRAASAEAFQAIRPIYEYNRKAPLQAETVAKRDFPAYAREKLVFSGVQQTRVPAYLAIPKAGKAPFPVVILLHGLTSSKDSWFEAEGWSYGNRVVDPLVAAGIAVLALDARLSRRARGRERLPLARRWERLPRHGGPDGDRASPRHGLPGYPHRARHGAHRRTRSQHGRDGGIRAHRGGLAGQGRRGRLMLMGRSDEYYSVDEARQLFESIAGARKELVFYDSGHRMPPEYAAKAVGWLLQYLKE